MNIVHPPSRVRYAHPDNGYPNDRNRAKALLQEGNVYDVARVERDNYMTKVFLHGFDLPFNSVLFEDAA